MRLNARAIDALAPTEGKQVDYFDAQTRGLSLRVSPSGTKTWMLMYRAQTATGPKLRRLSLGRYPALSLADARAEATQRQAAIMKDGADPALEKKKINQVLTVGDMASVYLDKHARINKRSWRKDEAILSQDILPVIGKLAPREVERAHIEQILDRVAARGTTTQQNRVFEIARGVFNWATGLYVDVPPTFGMKKRIKEMPRERNLSSSELKALWECIEADKTGKNGRPAIITEPISIALRLLLVTGQRVSEVSQAEKAEFDLQEKVWTIPASRAKNGRSHRVPLSPLAGELLGQAWQLSLGSDFLFPSSVKTKRGEAGEAPITPTSLNHALRNATRCIGLVNVRPHDFREAAATGMMFLGVPETHVSAVLNHVRATVTARHYARHSFEREKREALKIWARHLETLIPNARHDAGSAADRGSTPDG